MKSSHYYKLLVFALSLLTTETWAATFGDIPASLTLSSGTSVRRNSGNTLFEAYTPATGTVTSITATSPIVVTPSPITTTGVISIGNAAADGSTKGAAAFSWTLSIPTAAQLNVAKLTNLTTNGFVKTSGSDGTLGVDTSTYLTANQSITLSGDVTGTGATAITTKQTKKITFGADTGGVNVITTGVKIPVKIDKGGTLQRWTMTCSPSGSLTVDLLRSADTAGLPVTSMIGSGTKPAISSSTEAKGTISDWTTSTTLSDDDNLTVSLSGVSTATKFVITFIWQ